MPSFLFFGFHPIAFLYRYLNFKYFCLFDFRFSSAGLKQLIN